MKTTDITDASLPLPLPLPHHEGETSMSDYGYLSQQFAGIAPTALCDVMLQHQDASYAARQSSDKTEERQELLLFRAAQQQLAIEFGKARGWKLSNSDFGLRTLGEGKQHGGGGYARYGSFTANNGNPYPGMHRSQFDHPYYYRRNGKAAAIAAHLYAFGRNRDQCLAIAAQFGLTFELPDFPSWWNPCRPGYANGTTLVLYIGKAG